MKKLSYLLILNLFCLSLAFAQDKETPYFVKTYQSSDVDMVNVRTSGGGISVTGQAGGESRVEVYIRPNNWNGKELSKAEIEDRLENYELSVKKEGNTIFCVAKPKKENWTDWKKSLSISFKIYTPEKVSTNLRTSGGGISIKNITGNQDFVTSGGGLKVRNVGGNIKGRTSGGGIDVSGCRDIIDLVTSGGGIDAEDCKGDIRLSTSGGGLDLKDLDGKIKATTSGGGIRAENIKGDLVTSTSGGSIRLSDMYASVKATTSGGGIEADIRQLGNHLVLSTSAGNINVRMPFNKGMDLDLDGTRVRIPTLKNFDGVADKDRVKGRINGGGVMVSMDASSGGITISE